MIHLLFNKKACPLPGKYFLAYSEPSKGLELPAGNRKAVKRHVVSSQAIEKDRSAGFWKELERAELIE